MYADASDGCIVTFITLRDKAPSSTENFDIFSLVVIYLFHGCTIPLLVLRPIDVDLCETYQDLVTVGQL